MSAASCELSRRGMVLIVVLVVVVMISFAGFGFAALMLTESKAVHLHGEELQIAQVVQSAEEYLKTFLDQPPLIRQQAGGSDENRPLFRGVTVFEDPETGMRGRFSVISPRYENGRAEGIRFGLENESARLSLEAVRRWEEQQPGTGYEALIQLPGMTLPIANAILDWIDADNQPRQLGAEADYYQSLDPPYAPRNAVPSSIEELVLVKDVHRHLLFGLDLDENHTVEPHERSAAIGESFAGTMTDDELPWASLLTLYSGERNVRPDGRPRIKLNQSDLPGLHGLLQEQFDEEWSKFIVLYRQYGPSTASNTQKSAASVSIDFSVPGRFRIDSVLDLIDATVDVPSPGGGNMAIGSPFVGERSAMRSDLPRLLDHVTASDVEVIRGRVDVNQAPRSVLRAVPGLDEAVVEQIVASRSSFVDVDDPSRNHAVWLLTEGLVDMATMKSLEQYLTVGGDVMRAQIVGFFDTPGPVSRVEVVIDATTHPPRRLYWKDLRYLGRGYSLATLGAEPNDGSFGAPHASAAAQRGSRSTPSSQFETNTN